MESSIVYLRVNRLSREVCAAARDVTVSGLHEAMGVATARVGLMSPQMRPLNSRRWTTTIRPSARARSMLRTAASSRDR